MGNFFEETMQGLLEAIAIEKGNIPIVEVKDMPVKTYRVPSAENSEPVRKMLVGV